MRPSRQHPLGFALLAVAAYAMLATPCSAQTPAENLKRCLADFGGIQWLLPYRPLMHTRACASRAASYDTSDKPPEGQRSLELIGDLDLGADSTLPSDEAYVALQEAVFVHFDAILSRHGYRRIAVEHGDARTRRHAATQRLLQGRGSLRQETDEDEPPPLPPMPYVKAAHYENVVSGKQVRATYRTEARNTWRISLDGLSETGAVAGAPR